MKLTEIGVVESPYGSLVHPPDEGRELSRIVIHEAFAEGLHGLDKLKHIQVFFRLGPSGEYGLKYLTDCGEVRGVFATRGSHRPSPLGLATVELLRLEGNVLHVRGLHAADGSPVYDLKPWVAALDAGAEEEPSTQGLKPNPESGFERGIRRNDAARCRKPSLKFSREGE